MANSDVLVFGNAHTPSLCHEVPLRIADEMADVEHDGARFVLAPALELPRLRPLAGFEVLSFEELGFEELTARGKTVAAAIQEVVARGCERIGLREALTPRDFPIEMADHLRHKGLILRAAGDHFDQRRRAKNEAELAGVKRGLRAAEAAVAAIRERIRGGGPTTAEELHELAVRVFAENKAVPHEMGNIIAPGRQGADPHASGTGPIEPNQSVVLDIYPRDVASGCWGDLSRTVCLGGAPEWLRRHHADVRESQRLATEAVRPGISAEELFRISAQYLSDQGYSTRLDTPDKQHPAEGYSHVLGHGVGLEIHESPWLDMGNRETLVAGDVITIEPGLYFKDLGGVRLEDIVLVTDDGYELLTECPYDLEL